MNNSSAVSRRNFDPEKPYDVCLHCSAIGKICDGPNFLAMTRERWIEWCKERKEIVGITNSQIADLSGVPKGTVDRALSVHGGDIRLSTMQGITKVLVGDCWGKFPCSIHGGGEAAYGDMQKEINALKAENELLQNAPNVALAESKAESQKKIDYLKEQVEIRDRFIREKNTAIKVLAVALGIFVALVLFVMGVDILNGEIGFLRD